MDSVIPLVVPLAALAVSGWVCLRALRIMGDANAKTTAALISLTEKPSATAIAGQIVPREVVPTQVQPFGGRRPAVGSA